MKTQSIEWNVQSTYSTKPGWNAEHSLNRFFGNAARLFLALVPALAILVAAVWASTIPSLAQILQASLWGMGFIFLALAVDSENPAIARLVASGITLPVLALLSSRVAPEFAIIAAALVALWVAAWISGVENNIHGKHQSFLVR